MSRTVIDLDDDLLEQVAKTLGTTTKKDTVNTALAEILAIRRRSLALVTLREMGAQGDFDVLLDKKNYR